MDMKVSDFAIGFEFVIAICFDLIVIDYETDCEKMTLASCLKLAT